MVRKLIILAILLTYNFILSDVAFSASNPIPKVKVKEYIVKHSLEMGVDPALALSIAKQESNFCHELKSPYGAVGVFQLLPSTAKKMGYNPYYLSENIRGGLKYYQLMYNKFGSIELALAAYNAGPGNVTKYKGMPPFKETRSFVHKIMKEYDYQKNNPDPIIVKYKENSANSKEFLDSNLNIVPISNVDTNEESSASSDTEIKDDKQVILKDLLSLND